MQRSDESTVKKNKVFNRIVLVLLILSFLFCLLSHLYCILFYRQPADIRKNVQKGVPYVFQSNEDYFDRIQSVGATDDFVYVLFGRQAIVKVFRHDGDYIATIAVFYSGSGGVSLYTDKSRAYIDSNGFLYELEGTALLQSYSTTNGDFSGKLKAVQSASAPPADYTIRFGNVIKYAHTPQAYVFLQRDLWHRILHPDALIPAEFAVLLLWGLILIVWNKTSKQRFQQNER